MKAKRIVTIDLIGGLGNQLFQISAGAYLEEKYDFEVRYCSALLGLGTGKRDLSIQQVNLNEELLELKFQDQLLLNFFRRSVHRIGSRVKFLESLENKIFGIQSLDDEDFDPKKRFRRLVGYGQELNFFFLEDGTPRCRIEIPEIFCTNLDLLMEAKSIKPIGIHIRGGDYKSLESTFGNLSARFFESAIKQAAEYLDSDVPIWVFTDDPEYTKHLLGHGRRNYRILNSGETGDSLSTLILMTKTSMLITSNSTFSWWAGVLGNRDRRIFFPKPWFKNLPDPNLGLPTWTPIKSQWD